jgi:hypothetical protein
MKSKAVTKTRITDCADTEKKNQRMRMKKKKSQGKRGKRIFFQKNYGYGLKAKKNWQIRKTKKKPD